MSKKPISRKPTVRPDSSERGRTFPFLLACILIGLFAYRLLVPAEESPMRTVQLMTIAADIGMVAGLFVMRARIATPLFWIALAAGVGLFAIRATSDAAWWTGHLMFEIPPR